MKRIAGLFVITLLLSHAVEATPVTWTLAGVADSGQWNGTPLVGLAYKLTLFKDIDVNDFDLGDWPFLSAEIDVQTLGTHTFAFCTTSSPASCSTAPFSFIETFNLSNSSADVLHFRGPAGIGDSQVHVPFGTLGSNPEFLTPFGPVQTLGDGLTKINVQDGVPNNNVTPSFELHQVDSPTSRITASVTAGATTVPECGSSLIFLAVGGAVLIVTRHHGSTSGRPDV